MKHALDQLLRKFTSRKLLVWLTACGLLAYSDLSLLMFLVGFGLQEPLSLISWFGAGFVASYSFLIRFGIIGDERGRRR